MLPTLPQVANLMEIITYGRRAVILLVTPSLASLLDTERPSRCSCQSMPDSVRLSAFFQAHFVEANKPAAYRCPTTSIATYSAIMLDRHRISFSNNTEWWAFRCSTWSDHGNRKTINQNRCMPPAFRLRGQISRLRLENADAGRGTGANWGIWC